jgi:hypothetical protein
MKKLMLDVDGLTVESFATGENAAGRGTVRGHDTRYTEFCNTRTCGVITQCGCQLADEHRPAGQQEPVP